MAAASSLRPVLETLKPDFEERCECTLHTVYGSSGKLTAQILNGAPYDVFLSANRAYADTLYSGDMSLEPPRVFAKGQLVAWAVDTAIDLQYIPKLFLPGQPGRLRYAVPNPRSAPYGVVARGFLERTELWQPLQPQLVYGESVGQTGQFVLSGAADVGYVASSLPLSLPVGERGRFVVVPEYLSVGLEQCMVVLPGAAERADLVDEFGELLLGPGGREVLQSLGYTVR